MGSRTHSIACTAGLGQPHPKEGRREGRGGGGESGGGHSAQADPVEGRRLPAALDGVPGGAISHPAQPREEVGAVEAAGVAREAVLQQVQYSTAGRGRGRAQGVYEGMHLPMEKWRGVAVHTQYWAGRCSEVPVAMQARHALGKMPMEVSVWRQLPRPGTCTCPWSFHEDTQ